MSTEATGDGRPEAVDAAGPNVKEPEDDAGEVPGDYEEYADDEAPRSGDDEPGEYDEDYEEYEPGEADGVDGADRVDGADGVDGAASADEPRRSRRWPRVLLALGFVVLAVVIIGGAIAIVGSLTHGFKKPVKVTYKKSAVFSLKTGDCFNPQGQQAYTLIPCAAPHQAEVFATFALAGAQWPGATAVQSAAGSGCGSRLTGYLNPQLAISLASTYVYPDSVAWQAGTRTVICEVRATSGQLTGSVRGASATAG
jgi:hypothetical protein